MTPEPHDAPSVPLRVVHPASIDVAKAVAAFGDLSWLAPSVEWSDDGSGFRRVTVDLALPVLDRSGPGPVHKAAFVDLGPVDVVGDDVSLGIAWQSANLAPLFPVFAGRLEVRSDGLILDGRYLPPFGKLGLVIDRSLLHFVARRTAMALLSRLAARFDS
jgi:hypothetical protein